MDEWWGAFERMGWHMMQFALKRPDSPERCGGRLYIGSYIGIADSMSAAR